jgi:integrase
MAPRVRSYSLENRTQRLRLRVRRKPYSVQIAVRPAVRLAYRRNLGGGTWSVMAEGWMKAFATADDFEDANGTDILTYHDAVDRARQLARGSGEGDSGRPLTVAEAVDRYEADLKARGGEIKNASRVRYNLTSALSAKPLSLLVARELRQWRDGMLERMTPSSVNRVCNSLKAALNLAASLDSKITNSREWERGLEAIPDADESRNVILADDDVRTVVKCSYDESKEFGQFVEVLAVAGPRPSQAARLTVGDLQADRLMVPPSRKGGKKKRTEKRPVPIPPSLAEKLLTAAGVRPANALLLLRPDNEPWTRGLHQRPFQRVAKAAGLDPTVVTIYALRHSSIVRQLLAGVPVRVVASNHDTSVAMIEKTYSRYITDHTDALTRRALLDLDRPVSKAAANDNFPALEVGGGL